MAAIFANPWFIAGASGVGFYLSSLLVPEEAAQPLDDNRNIIKISILLGIAASGFTIYNIVRSK